MGRGGLAIVAILSLAMAASVAAPPPPAADTPTSEEILVVAKLKVVRLSYGLFGGHLKACTVDTSSGDPSADRLACALVQLCVRTGATRREQVYRCVNKSLREMDAEGRAALAAESVVAAPPPLLPPLPGPAPAAPPSATPEKAADPEIVVKGRVREVEAGLWLFQEVSASKSRFTLGVGPSSDQSRISESDRPARFRSWRMCLSPKGVEIALGRLLEPAFSNSPEFSRPYGCARWTISVTGTRFVGRKRCYIDKARITEEANGAFDERNLTATKSGRFLVPNGRGEWWSELVGARIGECGRGRAR